MQRGGGGISGDGGGYVVMEDPLLIQHSEPLGLLSCLLCLNLLHSLIGGRYSSSVSPSTLLNDPPKPGQML